jgi:hypothetical protein
MASVPGPVQLPVQFPLSGNVSQVFAPWIGQVTVNLGNSSDPETEEKLIKGVASYGKQLGRIENALLVLIKHLPLGLPKADQDAIDALTRMVGEIAAAKPK